MTGGAMVEEEATPCKARDVVVETTPPVAGAERMAMGCNATVGLDLPGERIAGETDGGGTGGVAAMLPEPLATGGSIL
jgi:hypothetical protein